MQENRCGDCAYKVTERGNIWCKFYERNVRENDSCNNYLNFLDEPGMASLMDDVFGKRNVDGEVEKTKQTKPTNRGKHRKIPNGKDVLAWIIAIILILIAAILFLYE